MLGSQNLLKVHLNHSDNEICQRAYKVRHILWIQHWIYIKAHYFREIDKWHME